ncbi:MAG: YceI family protein [Flavobacteriales bacterium]
MRKIFLAVAVLSFVFTACKSEKKVEAKEAKEVTEIASDSRNYKANIAQTVIEWEGAHLGGIAPHNGTVKIKEGTIKMDGNQIVGGKFTVDFTTIENEDLAEKPEVQAKLMKHIKHADILNVEKFPEATFEITSVEVNEGVFNSMITGNLMFLGSTKSITFPANVTYSESQITLDSDQFVIDRTQWGLMYGSASEEEITKMDEKAKSKVISNDIKLKIKAVANQ